MIPCLGGDPIPENFRTLADRRFGFDDMTDVIELGEDALFHKSKKEVLLTGVMSIDCAPGEACTRGYLFKLRLFETLL